MRAALRAAARVHCGRPPSSPVLRASPARFAHVAAGAVGIVVANVGGVAAVGVVVIAAVNVGGVAAVGAAVGVVTGGGVLAGKPRVGARGAASGAGDDVGAGATCRAPALVRLPRLGCTKRSRASDWLRRQATMISWEAQSGDGSGDVTAT